MMAFLQGAPLPDITETTTKADQAPQYYTDYLSGLAGAGTTALGKTPGQLVAGLDPLQVKAYGGMETAAGAYKPGLEAAGETAAGAAAGVTPERLASFMNPYTKNVVEEMARLSEQNIQRNLLPSLKAGMVGSGQLGSQRYAGALGQGLAESARTLTGQQYGALSEGYKTALDAALREMGQETEAAKAQANIAKLEQDLGLAGMGALSKAGAEQQAYQQAMLDAPLKTAAQVQNLLRGFTIPTTSTTTFVGPRPGAYEQSGLASTAGLLSLLGAASTGTAFDRLSGILGKVLGQAAPNIDWAGILANQGVQNPGSEAGGAVQDSSGMGSV